MSVMNGQTAWPPPAQHQVNGNRQYQPSDDASALLADGPAGQSMPEAAPDLDEDHQQKRQHFADLYRRTEEKISFLFADDGSYNFQAIDSWRQPLSSSHLPPPTTDHAPIQERPTKRAKRIIDEDDYGDDDEDEEEEDENDNASPLKGKNGAASGGSTTQQLLSPSKSGSSPVHSVTSPGKLLEKTKEDGSSGSQSSQQGQSKSSEDARKQLEEARNAAEEGAKRGFHSLFYTLENDRTAMLEQQQLEESEKQLQAEMDKNHGNQPGGAAAGQNQGSLSNTNLGTSSLTLKNLIARIDQFRDKVPCSDGDVRSLLNEVRKNRSKWASEEAVNQEELYEALEKVLNELKAHTEYSTPFLTRVNKRDAPDYYNFITKPMDLGTMAKKLKSLTYKSKTEFVADLNLIWDNCLRYNQDMNHPLRRMANGMRKEAEKLIPLIPDLVVRPRAEVEAEERRKQNGGEDDGDSDDEPIMTSRGRTAGGTKGTKSRKAPSDQKEGTPSVEQKPVPQFNGLLIKAHREGSEVDGSNGFATPPVGGSITPGGMNGHSGIGSNIDAMDVDGPSMNGMALGQALTEAAQQVFEDEEYKIWKQVTKKDRALVAKDRFQLFSGNKLNPDEPALLRTKGAMRRFLRGQQQAEALGLTGANRGDVSGATSKDSNKASESLAEGMEDQVEKVIPDYYEPQSLIPDVPTRLRWIEDSEGLVINQHEEFLRALPSGYFSAPAGHLSQRFDANLRQMQETRKLCSKISVIKQMQIQTQTYANQFPKYNPEPFLEADAEAQVVCGDDIVMAPEICRAAMQRSVAKIFYHAGFEELQPSALETITDVAADYFGKLLHTFNVYSQAEKMDATPVYAQRGARFQPRYTDEEVLLHTLHENGYAVESLESYAKDEIDRLGNKLGGIHERMKAYLGDLLRPAVNEPNADGSGAFNDGSEQFVGGDFADELGEDFFGFKELGLAEEMGGILSVPLHLLQTRVRAQYQNATQTVDTIDKALFEDLPVVEPITKENIHEQIGLVKNFFLAKLHANGDTPLVEDEDLPVKQRRPRPRLGATGKIVSPQKRPPKEQNAINKKKKKMEAQAAEASKIANSSPEKGGAKNPVKKGSISNAPPAQVNGTSSQPVAPPMERGGSTQSQGNNSQTDKDDTGMMSPESMER